MSMDRRKFLSMLGLSAIGTVAIQAILLPAKPAIKVLTIPPCIEPELPTINLQMTSVVIKSKQRKLGGRKWTPHKPTN
jgi:hypothetical protein